MKNYLLADGFDEAIIGIDIINEKIIYSKGKMVEMMCQEMSYEESIQFLEHNTWNTDAGKHTPIYCDEMTMQELDELYNELK